VTAQTCATCAHYGDRDGRPWCDALKCSPSPISTCEGGAGKWEAKEEAHGDKQ
jgi:hypothetical protein